MSIDVWSALTVLVAVFTTETFAEPWFVTETRVPSGVTATPPGALPTRIVPTTVLITDTVSESRDRRHQVRYPEVVGPPCYRPSTRR